MGDTLISLLSNPNMKTKKAFFFPLFLFFLLISSSSSTSPYPQINVWPKPTNISWQNPHSMTFLSPSFQILSPSSNNKHLHAAIKRYTTLVLTEKHHPLIPPPPPTTTTTPLKTLTVSVSNPYSPLQHGVDESYSLWIGVGDEITANLLAETVWGAIWGLETFSQLVWARINNNPTSPSYIPTGIYISDRPLFPHRGIMLDTSRNYYPVRDIMRTIRAMSANKLNVFHWHITDSHSFPIVLPSEPDLSKKGSYGPRMEYSPSDVKRIVEFGFRHGVRVMPEIDAPGHTGSWAGAYPDIVTCANKFWLPDPDDWAGRLAAEPGTGHLNPLKPQTYQVLHNVIRDITTLFPEPFFHGGADEITPGCWKTDPTIKSFLSNDGTLSQVLEIFINSTHPHIISLNRTAVYWEDVFLDSDVRVVDRRVLPPETTILQTWNNGPNNTKRIVEAGYRVIVSSADFYYLDCGHGDFMGNDSRYDEQVGDPPGEPFNFAGGDGGSWCGPFKTWQRVYDYDVTHGLTEEEAKLVLGGEVALWSEQADPTVLDAQLWPRASAMAETMWSGNRDRSGKKRYAEAADRLNQWRYRMVRRGIRAEPIQPLWCTFNRGMCNLVP